MDTDISANPDNRIIFNCTAISTTRQVTARVAVDSQGTITGWYSIAETGKNFQSGLQAYKQFYGTELKPIIDEILYVAGEAAIDSLIQVTAEE